MNFLANFFALSGAVFTLIAALGVARFPDFFCRMHAATKAGAFGGTLMLLAAVFAFPSLKVTIQSVLIILFFYMTTPVASHLLGRSAARASGALTHTHSHEISGPKD